MLTHFLALYLNHFYYFFCFFFLLAHFSIKLALLFDSLSVPNSKVVILFVPTKILYRIELLL